MHAFSAVSRAAEMEEKSLKRMEELTNQVEIYNKVHRGEM